jgi:hypothetical protein
MSSKFSVHFVSKIFTQKDNIRTIPEGKGLLGKRSCRWENDIKTNLKELDWEDVGWICLAHDVVG